MARSTYIYLVRSRCNPASIYAAFTVKREARQWTLKLKDPITSSYLGKENFKWLELYRMKDNPKEPFIGEVISW